MSVKSQNEVHPPSASSKCLTRSVLDVLAQEPTLEAVSINPAEHKISVATLGQTDVLRLSSQLTERLQQAQAARTDAHCALLEGVGNCSSCDAPPSPEELRGEMVFFGRGRCASCHTAETAFQDNAMHDLHVERFYPGRPEGPIKTFSLRGIKDSPPYLHDGRLPTLEDAAEFFNLIFQLKLTKEEKVDLVAFLRTL